VAPSHLIITTEAKTEWQSPTRMLATDPLIHQANLRPMIHTVRTITTVRVGAIHPWEWGIRMDQGIHRHQRLCQRATHLLLQEPSGTQGTQGTLRRLQAFRHVQKGMRVLQTLTHPGRLEHMERTAHLVFRCLASRSLLATDHQLVMVHPYQATTEDLRRLLDMGRQLLQLPLPRLGASRPRGNAMGSGVM